MSDKPTVKQQVKEMRKADREAKIQTRKNSPINYIMEQQKIRVRQDALKLRVARQSCENIFNYNRYLLHNIFRETVEDPNLTAQWTSRKMKTLEKPFKFCNDAGEEDEEFTRLFETQWFYDFISHALDSKLWGFTPLEFGPLVNGEFQPYQVKTQYGIKNFNAVNVLDRDNVKPELGIITNMPGDTTGVSFDDPKYASYLMMISSDFRDYGILGKAAKYILFKDNALGNWSEWAEVFGMDTRIGKTNSEGLDRQRFITAMRDLGSNSYGVFQLTDEIEYIGSNHTDAYQVYLELIKKLDGDVTKLVFGQDVVSNETGKLKGTVGENIANMYGDNDARFTTGLVNKKLKPLMENLGFDWKGLHFKYDTTEKLKLAERSDVDLKITQMGFKIDPEYIEQTYGTPVEEKVEPTELPADKQLKNLYE
jgi:hypothetical protein